MAFDKDAEMERVRFMLWSKGNSAFLGSVLCGLNFHWSTHVDTAGTDGINLYFNPDFFEKIPVAARVAVLAHEVYHVARLHHIRGEGKDHERWNIACDIRINNDMVSESNLKHRFDFTGTNATIMHEVDRNGRASEEEIYEKLDPSLCGGGSGGNKGYSQGFAPGDRGDLQPMETTADKQKVINTVSQALQQAKHMQQWDDSKQDIQSIIDKLLEPLVPWEQVLKDFFTDLTAVDYSWRVRNRRYAFSEMYMPGMIKQEDGLEHLLYCVDVSGSISDDDIAHFNTELKHIKDTFNPQKLTIAQFDTSITTMKVVEDDDDLNHIEVIGRGGTDLEPVRQLINELQPTACVVFSDMWCAPMQELNHPCPIIWVVTNNTSAEVPFGKMCHIQY